MPVRKRARKEGTAAAETAHESDVPRVVVQLLNEREERVGSQVMLPIDATPQQLDELLGTLVGDDEKQVPHAFFLQGDQILSDVSTVVHKQQKDAWVESQLKEGRRVRSTDADQLPLSLPEEKVLQIVFKPQAVFRVRPVTRCVASLDGHSEAVLIVSFSPDGRCLATGGGDNEIRIWDVFTLTPTTTLKAHNHWVQVLAWSPNTRYLASGSRDGGLIAWTHDDDYGNFKGTPLKGHRNYLSHISWEPLHVNGACDRFVSASKDATLKVWRVPTGLQFSLSGHQSCVTCVKWGGENRIYSSSQDKVIIVWNASDGSVVAQLRGHAHWVNFVALSTDLVLRTGAFDHTEKKFESESEAQAYAKSRYAAVLERSGTERLVSCSDDNTMMLWEPLKSTECLVRMTGHQGVVFHIAFSPDGTLVASCGADKAVKVWSAIDGKFLFNLRGHVAAVYHVSWSLDSRLLVSGSKDSTLKLWSIATKKLVEDMTGHSDEIFSTDWSPDGQRVATGSKDKQVRIWTH